MIFSLVILVLIAGIAYFHLVQGLLSGIISMVLAVTAATLAVGYHEAIVTGILGGKMADYANGMMLCIIFAAIYGIGRVVFDSLIPGNVRLPHMLDVIGGTACGIVVGIVAAGVLAVAMQSMPLGPSILMHTRYAVAEDRDVNINGARRQEVARISGALEKDLPGEDEDLGLWVGADNMLLNYTAYQSEAGALAGGTKLRDRHPNLLRELFFQRVGMETGVKRTALNVGGKKDVAVVSVFAPPQPLLQMDGENPSLTRGRKLPKQLAADPSKVVLVVRVGVQRSATDSDSLFRFSPGSTRLLANGKDFWPQGVLYEPGRVNLLMNFRIDDYLFAALDAETGEATIDLVFIVDKADILEDPTAKEGLKFKKDAFIEVKRLARVDLTDQAINSTMPVAPPGSGMKWKTEAVTAIKDRMAEPADSTK
jgi:hypothetical protein